jgi:predicted aspartyl protease
VNTRRSARAVSLLAAAVVTAAPLSGAVEPERVSSGGVPGVEAGEQRADSALVALVERSEAGDTAALQRARNSVANPRIRAVVDSRLAAARLDLRGTRAALKRVAWRGIPVRWRAIALATRAAAAFAQADYAAADSDCRAWLELPEGSDPIHQRSDIEQMHGIAAGLAALPRQAVEHWSPGTAATTRDKASLTRTYATITGVRQEVVLDTGANLSVVTVSTANALGLRVVGGSSVQSSTRRALGVRLAVAHRLEIAGTSLRNVPFLVLEDADLRLPLPGGYEIPAIIGLPVLRALRRVTFTAGALATGSGGGGRGEAPNMVASGSELFVRARINGLEVPLHFDSGASDTSLGPRFAADHPGLVAGLAKRSSRVAGAGGAVENIVSVLGNADVEVGGVTMRLPAMDVARAAPVGNFGTLGQDLLRSKESYTIDFERMTLTLGATRDRFLRR